MAYKVNYNFQKAERDRAKAAKKEAKLRDKQAARAAGGTDGDSRDAGSAGAEPAGHEEPAPDASSPD